MTDLATLQNRLTEAETARHEMAMGRTVTQSSYTDHGVSLAAVSMADLDAYIERLKREIAAKSSTSARRPRRFGVSF